MTVVGLLLVVVAAAIVPIDLYIIELVVTGSAMTLHPLISTCVVSAVLSFPLAIPIIYHDTSCVDHWLLLHPICPYCRTEVFTKAHKPHHSCFSTTSTSTTIITSSRSSASLPPPTSAQFLGFSVPLEEDKEDWEESVARRTRRSSSRRGRRNDNRMVVRVVQEVPVEMPEVVVAQ